jgi:hypothetical protein
MSPIGNRLYRNLSEVLKVSEDTVFGNQTPFTVDACLKELFPVLKFGANRLHYSKEPVFFSATACGILK